MKAIQLFNAANFVNGILALAFTFILLRWLNAPDVLFWLFWGRCITWVIQHVAKAFVTPQGGVK